MIWLLFSFLMLMNTFFMIVPETINLDMESSSSIDKQRYKQLLNSIVKINEQRLNAVKKLTQLKNMDVWNLAITRTNENGPKITNSNEDDEDDKQNLLGFIVFQRKPIALRTLNYNESNIAYRQRKKELIPVNPKMQSFNYIDKANDTECYIAEDTKAVLRKRWDKSFQKKAAKVCKNACIEATKNACEATKCTKKEKQNLKKECKIECRNKFVD